MQRHARPWTFALCSFRTASLPSGAPACSAWSSSPSTCLITAYGPRSSRRRIPASRCTTRRCSRDLPRGVEVERARTLEPGYGAKRAAWRAAGGPIARARGGARSRRAACARSAGWRARRSFPDPQILWQPAALGALARRLAARRDDAVLVSGPPFSQFLLAPLARAGRVGVVLDYRDEWSTTAQRLRDDAIAHRAARRRSARGRAPPPGARRRRPRPTSFARTSSRASRSSTPAASSPSPTATTRTTSRIRSPSPPAIDSSSPTRARSSR